MNLVHRNTVFNNSSNFDNLADLYNNGTDHGSLKSRDMWHDWVFGRLPVIMKLKDGSFLALKLRAHYGLNQAKLLPNLPILNFRSLLMRLGLKT